MNKFGSRSLRKLQGVNPTLVEVSHRALQLSPVDFGITEGLRSRERQRILVDTGRSKTMNSYHLTGHAVDVVAYVDGGYTYEPFRLYEQIADAFRLASIELGVDITWGAAWLAPLANYDSAHLAKSDYIATRFREGRKPFLDGPHFQLRR